ncbi:hypothetical protein H6785_00615 [Candidatus Nomurabacteria bacterium]|nr:hypothetical protein [Candidatus Nomurabacteria bacterium]
MISSQVSKLLAQSAVLTLVALSLLTVGFAQVMEGKSYNIQSDSVNSGGWLASSTSYVLESTIGEIASGLSDSTSYSLRAGYQQMQEAYLSISVSGDVDMFDDLPGITGGESNGSTTITVMTDSPSGYILYIAAENSPAMQSGANTIADYVPLLAKPDFNFTTDAAEAHLAYSPEGSDIVSYFKDNGLSCNAGTAHASQRCWEGLSTTNRAISAKYGSNHPNGVTTTVYFKIGIGNGAGVVPGVYTATTTVTALPL